MLRRVLVLLVLLAAMPCLAQEGMGNGCTLAGTWYGGSVVAYQLTIVPSVPAGHYSIFAQGMYKATAITATVTGEVVKKGNAYEGSMLSLIGDDSFVNLPPGANGKMPDLNVGWQSIVMLDCNTIKNTIPFFGTYFGPPSPPSPFGKGIWEPGTPWSGVNWIAGGKVPLLDAPDVDLIPILTGDTKPIVETYHRLLQTVNPALLHHN